MLLEQQATQQHACCDEYVVMSAQSELDSLLQPCAAARTPKLVAFYGVSPPVRSGAANPCSHDPTWARRAYSASHTNLEALRELDGGGGGVCCGGGGGGGCVAAAAAGGEPFLAGGGDAPPPALVLVPAAAPAAAAAATPAAAAAAAAPGCLRSRLAGAACPQQQQQQQALGPPTLALGASPARPPVGPRAGNGLGASDGGAPKPALEPFSCHTQYYA